MPAPQPFPLVAVDVGNSRVKLGLFSSESGKSFPQPDRTLALGPDWTTEQIREWLGPVPAGVRWLISSVHRAAGARIVEGARAGGGDARLLSRGDLHLKILAEHPETVGMDRLVNAVAANRLRSPDQPAIVVDVGSAIKVDLVSREGAFLGGAIFPGIGMSARALDEFTDLLPLVPVTELAEPPEPRGTSTIPAIRSGLFWGAVGGIRELVGRLQLDHPAAQVFLAGGAAPSVAELILDRNGKPARHVPHLTLGGIALSATVLGATAGG